MITNNSTKSVQPLINKASNSTVSHVTNSTIINNMVNLDVKVHKEIIFEILKHREKINKYQTNKEIKQIALFYLLKHITTSGVVKEYAKNLQSLLTITGLSQGTFYTQLRGLKKKGLVRKNAHNLILSNYNTLLELYDVQDITTPITIKFNPSTHKFTHLLEFSTLADNMYRQSLLIKKKLEKSPYTLEILQRYAKQQSTAKTLAVAQKHAFVNGSDEINTLFFINPNITITWKRLFREFNFKSYKSVAYLKKKLQRNKIVTIEKNGFFTSKVGAKTKAYNDELDKTVNTCRYNKKLEKTQKQFADHWNLAPNLYVFTPYYKN